MGELLVLGAVVLVYLLVRNDWIYENSIEMIKRDLSEYKRLPSLSYMLFRRPFCWDFKKFLLK